MWSRRNAGPCPKGVVYLLGALLVACSATESGPAPGASVTPTASVPTTMGPVPDAAIGVEEAGFEAGGSITDAVNAAPDVTPTATPEAGPDAPSDAAPADAGRGQVVILKLDNSRAAAASRAAFQKAADIILRKQVKAGFGAIGQSWVNDGTNQAAYDWVKTLAATGRIEFWHHGFDHLKAADNSWYEFQATTAAAQLDHLRQTLEIFKVNCSITMHSFGAPYNHDDATTAIVMKQVPEIEVWMFPTVNPSGPMPLTARVNIETATGVLDEAYFQTNYAASAGAPYIVMQAHPPYWLDAMFPAFERIIDYLIARGARFLTPYEYYVEETSAR